MKRLLLFLIVFLLCVPTFCDDCEERHLCPPCFYHETDGWEHDIYLCGNVRVVEDPNEPADLTVYLCRDDRHGAELIVKWVDSTRYDCGCWHLVDKNEDFSVRFVDDYWQCNLRIRYGNPDKHNHANEISPYWGQF